MPRCAANKIESHPGNVLLTVSDKRLPQCSATVVTGHTAYVISATDYSAFGATLPDRTRNADGYRFGFNGKEKDNEVQGDGNQYDYGFRIYNPRLGKFLSVDPLTKEYPWNSTYAFAENDVIRSIDLEGLEKAIYTIVRDKDEGGSRITTVNVKTLDPPGPLGEGAAVILNRYGVKSYLYGERAKDIKDFVSHYEGRKREVHTSVEGGNPTGGIGHKLNDSKERKAYPVGTALSDEIIDKWFDTDWNKKTSLVEKNTSTKDLVGGQKEAIIDFVFNGLPASAFKKGDNETFFGGYLKGEEGTVKKRVGQMILFRDNEKYNLDFVKDKNRQQKIEKHAGN